jgi:hypothetical protein
MGLASTASACKLSSSCIGLACLDFFAFGARAVVRLGATETLPVFKFALVVRLTALDDFGTGTARLFSASEERDSEPGLNAVSSVSTRSHIL